MTFGDYVRLIRTYWRSIVLTIVVGVGVATGLSFAMTPQYTADAQVLFNPVSSTASGQDLAQTALYVQARMVVYQGLATTPQVLGPVVSTLNLTQTPTQLADHVKAEYAPTSTILTIKVTDPDAGKAARISRAVSQSLIAAVGQFELQQDPTLKGTDNRSPRVSGQLVTDPAQPTSPSSPNFKLNIAAGALLGIILGLAQAAARFLRSGFGAPRQQRERRRWWWPFAPKEAAAAPATAPVSPVSSLQPPKAPGAAKPKEPQRPGRRTRRRDA